ncbi:MAG: hypothetical protein ACRCYY_13865 [Trueperaceae bacterium]
MKTVTLSETAYATLERYRQRKGVPFEKALEQMITHLDRQAVWEMELLERNPKALELTEVEAELLAGEAVRETRRKRR